MKAKKPLKYPKRSVYAYWDRSQKVEYAVRDDGVLFYRKLYELHQFKSKDNKWTSPWVKKTKWDFVRVKSIIDLFDQTPISIHTPNGAHLKRLNKTRYKLPQTLFPKRIRISK